MDKCEPSDAEFDSYWDYEAKNKNRNRIRVGRQYQASIPPLLKPGEKDGRKSEDLEILKWKPHQTNELDVEQYLYTVKSVTSFAEVIEDSQVESDISSEGSLQIAFKGLAEFVTSHHPCHRDTGCKVPVSCSSAPPSASPTSAGELSTVKAPFGGDWTDPETRLFAQAVESYGKNFCAIKKEYLPWKPVKSLIEYYYAKEVKSESCASSSSSSVPSHVLNKVKEEKPAVKEEPVACCSRDSFQQSTHAKEEGGTSSEAMKQDPELRAASASGVASSSSHPQVIDSSVQNLQDGDAEARSTVGSLKFFLGGRLVLKLNAQQDNSAGTKCQWVQSSDASKHGHASKKQKHRRKGTPETLLPAVDASPKNKKNEENATIVTDGGMSATKKAKFKAFESDSGQSSLCSVSWTPPIADGHESVELEDGSSKTSEGCISPVVMATVKSETVVVESKRKMVNSVDHHKSWSRNESAVLQSVQAESHYRDEHSPIAVEKFLTKPVGEDSSHSFEMLNHKSALTRVRGSNYVSRTVHAGSPSSKLFNRWPSPNTDFQDRVKCSPSFPSPNSRTCSSSSENSVKAECILDLSSRLENCESHVDGRQEVCCQASPDVCTENCSSSDGSPHTPCSANDCSTLCCKSSNCSAYHSDVPATLQESSDNHHSRTNISAECGDRPNCTNENDDKKFGCCSASSAEAVPENSVNCPCCYNPATSCSSMKCCKGYSSKEPLCNKKNESGKSPSSSPNSMLLSNDEMYAKKMPEWLGGPTPPLVQMYPHCYPYYVSYGVNPAGVSNSNSTSAELPLDLSSNGNSKEDKSSPENVPQEQQELPANSADVMDRGMLYQLLKNRVTK